MLTDAQIIEAGAAVAVSASSGFEVPPAILTLLQAISATQDEHQRHDLARRAEERARTIGEVTVVGLQILRAAFGLGVP